jgi:hypothetical protein
MTNVDEQLRSARCREPSRISCRKPCGPATPIRRDADRCPKGHEAADHRLFVLRDDPAHGTRACLSRSRETRCRHRQASIACCWSCGVGFTIRTSSSAIRSRAWRRLFCPDVRYDDLDEIADGASAAAAFWQMAGGRGTFRQWVERRNSFRTKAELR